MPAGEDRPEDRLDADGRVDFEGLIDGSFEPEDPFDEGDGSTSVLRGAARAAVLLTAAGLVGQVFTLIRELFVADKVGVSEDLDALLVAAVVPIMFASLLASGSAAAIVPGYLTTRREHGRLPADRLLGAILTWTIIIGVGFAILVTAGANFAVTISGPGLDPRARDLAVAFVPIVAPMLVFIAAGALMSSTFQIHDRMRAIAVAWMIGPAASVVVTLSLWDQLGLTALAVAMTVQQMVIVAVLVVLAIRFRIMPPFVLRADRVATMRFVRHAAPLTISASVLNFNLLTDRAIGTLITPGAVSALRYAEGVIRIPMSAIVPAWTAAIYPALVRASLLSEARTFTQAAGSALGYIMAIFVPLSVATAALSPLIVEVAYVRGAFDERASILTAAALAGFAPLLVLTMVQAVLTGAHNARKRGVFLMAMGFLDAILNVVFNIGFGLVIGVAGIALSTSLTMGIIQIVKAWRLGSLEETFALGPLMAVSLRSLVASAVVALPIALVAWTVPHGIGLGAALAALVGLTSVGLVGYLALARVIKLDEPWVVLRAMAASRHRLRPGAR